MEGNKSFKSINSKILKATLEMMIVATVLIMTVTFVVVSRISKKDSKKLIEQMCNQETLHFNDEFEMLEDSVITVSEYIKTLEKKTENESELISDEFCSQVEEITISIANRTDGAMSVYFRYNPEITGNGTGGFFWSRNSSNQEFVKNENTDILMYDENDSEHVGWFYKPKQTGQAMWMTPYYNKNLNVFMISYIIPYYTSSGKLLGVVGMDIDFNEIVSITDEVKLYQTGEISLFDITDGLIYNTDDNGTVNEKNANDNFYKKLVSENANGKVRKCKFINGKNYLVCGNTLKNGMKLMLYVKKSETENQRNELLLVCMIFTLLAIGLTFIVMFRFTQRITKPIEKLTEITEKYARGDWGETFISDTGDEIQKLSKSITIMASTTKTYIDEIQRIAMTDALTGIKNKNCYLSYVDDFCYDETKKESEYAIVVMDINNLKTVNDVYGHELGDAFIKAAGKYIVSIFKNSQVFRIGGDEFVAILEDGDYRVREELLGKFRDEMSEIPEILDDVKVVISYGMAEKPKDGTEYAELFKLADDRMYECKKKLKASNKIESKQ